ncbi:unnamed protein product [Penicillium olsonii]|uniref:Zn(2)-C6 fungal-type domain-containing protein n=1 Tax=Penicillium olsonii TaxID=99116 RepID=A0A9W4MQB4_PENOL|nr:unnamed protein product [Penicillium olsonii]CAG8122519.1 unnamed protein product [Penicillium olsonii]
MGETLNPAAEIPKKRTRVQFSCTACRYRKLKCCRNHPCSNCKRRGEAASCTYVGRGPRGKAQHGRSSPTLVQDRLHHLENLVMSLAQNQRPDSDTEFANAQSENNAAYATPSPGSCDPNTESAPVEAGTLVVKNEGTSYIDSANWRAILEEINGVKEYLDENQRMSEDEDIEFDSPENSSPFLLLGNRRPVTKEEVLLDIPRRSIADRLVSRFLKTSEPARIAIHIPTFQKEYEQFWLQPIEKSFTWISLLYSVLALSVSIYHRSAEPLPPDMANPMTLWSMFQRRSAECLIQANYITPGRHKVDALLFYSLTEFYRSQDAQIGVSYLVGITIRLAMRMGYHRDSSHYSMLSAFEGEMRRRVWALLTQLDTLISFQIGVPRTIQTWQFDTELPSNLLDADFDETSVKLPSERPKDERTDCSYTRAKAHIMRVFGQITDLAFSREHSSYDEILEIDRRLEAAHDLVPPFLQIRSMTHCIVDPADLIMRRFALELLYHKARLVLHRRYIGETNPKFAYSRSVCLNSARESLRHHTEIFAESQPGGQLYAERYFLNSLQNTDFLLSAMILCLGLSQDEERGDSERLDPHERADFFNLLETTLRIFMESQHQSVDTQRAVSALSIMLKRVRDHNFQRSHLTTGGQSLESMTGHSPSQLAQATLQNEQFSMYPATQNATIPSAGETPSYTSLGVIEDMLDGPAQLDWRLYDSRISGVEMATNHNVWYSENPATPYDFTGYSPMKPPTEH